MLSGFLNCYQSRRSEMHPPRGPSHIFFAGCPRGLFATTVVGQVSQVATHMATRGRVCKRPQATAVLAIKMRYEMNQRTTPPHSPPLLNLTTGCVSKKPLVASSGLALSVCAHHARTLKR